jgi:two-component system sensor kinase FixL
MSTARPSKPWLPGFAQDDCAEAAEIRAEQLASFARHTPINSAVSVAISLVVALSLWDGGQRISVMVWAGVIWAAALWHLFKWWSRRDRPKPRSASRRGPRKAVALAVFGGLVWGSSVVFYGEASDMQRMLLMISVIGIVAGGSTTLGAIPAAAAALIVISLLPWIGLFLLQDAAGHFALASMALIYMLAMLGATRSVYAGFIGSVKAKLANAALLDQFHRERDEWFEISDTTDAFALFDAQDHLLLWNRNYQRYFSLPEDALYRGAPRAEILGRSAMPLEVEEGRLSRELWIERQMRLGDDPGDSLVEQFSNGRWLRSSLRRTSLDHSVALHVDITALREQERELRQNEAWFKAFLDHSPVEIGLKDLDGRYIVVSRNFEDENGMPADEAEGKMASDVYAEEVARVVEAHDREVLESGRTIEREIEVPSDQGAQTYLTVKFPVRDTAGEVIAIGAVAANITERKRAEQALRESQRQFQDFAASSADWFWEMDDQLRFTYVSPNIERMVGVAPEWHYGKTRRDLMGEDFDPALWDEHLKTLEAHKPFRDFVYPRVGEGIEMRWLRSSGMPIFAEDGGFLGYRGSGSDVTAAIEAQQALAASEAQLRLVTDSLPQLIALVDKDRRYLLCNRAYEDWHGIRREDIIGRRVEELHGEAAYAVVGPRLERALTGETVDYEDRISFARLGLRHFRAIYVPHKAADGTVLGCFLSVSDITQRKQAEEALRERETRLQDLQRQLEHVSRLSAMGQLSSALAHELNQPLTAIMNYIQAGRRLMESNGGVSSPRVDEMLDKAIDQSGRAGDVIRRLRGLFERGETEPSLESINEVVQDAASLALVDAEAHNISYRLTLHDGLPAVMIDKIQIQQVVLNLVRNAVEALEHSERRDLEIETAGAAGGDVEVAVRDTGPGLPAEVEKSLFEPFVTTKENTMGVGLSISHRIVEAHGGRLWAEANPGGGAQFRFTLPVLKRADKEDVE